MLKDLIIRQETPADYHQTEQMVMRSFWNKYWPGCTEHLLTRIIRDSRDYVPELSRVAEWNGQIVGAIYYTRAWIVDGDTRREVVTFGPLAVEPMMEGNDIGGALVRETLGLAGSFGAPAPVEELMNDTGRDPKPDIQRYKGLGEMSSEQLWQTTMNPETRTMMQITVEDAMAADETMSLLMGEKVDPRKEFIEQNAKLVTDLDF